MAPRFFCAAPLAGRAVVELAPAAAHHARRVLRLAAGDAVTLFDGSGGEYTGSIEGDGAAVRVRIAGHDPVEREPPLAIVLAQALVVGEKMDWLVQKAVELGAAAVAPVETERSVVRLTPGSARAAKRIEHLRHVAVAACEQCGRNRVPEVRPVAGLPQFLAEQAAPATIRLLLAPGAQRRLSALAPPGGEILVLIGPEGGLSDSERLAAASCGFEEVSLGPRVLRTETAGLAALAGLLARWGDL